MTSKYFDRLAEKGIKVQKIGLNLNIDEGSL